MGIIRAAVNAVHGSLADQWLETVEPYEMGEHTVFTEGILVRKGQNKKGSQTISNGSVIHVYDNQFMMLVDGGKIIDYTAEPGYFTVDQSSSPSMFSGSLDAAVKDTFERLKFGGQTPHEQRVFYINLQEIKGIMITDREIRKEIIHVLPADKTRRTFLPPVKREGKQVLAILFLLPERQVITIHFIT